MRVLILSDSNSPHTIKWAKSIAEKNISVGIFSIHKSNPDFYNGIKNIKIFDLGITREIQNKTENNISKIFYLKGVYRLKSILNNFKPDILHSHYASSYGLIGALSRFNPYLISVWGSDVFQFPNYSKLYKKILEFNLSKADKILSTSIALKKETEKYTSKDILITPFGVDTNIFKKTNVNSIFPNNDFIIGTIKTLEKNYGIEYLIRAFNLLKLKYNSAHLKLLIVGKGTQLGYLQDLVKSLNIQGDVVFTGYVNHNEIVKYHNMLDLSVFPSLEESFGVSVLEASACEKPVIVTNVGGLPEVVENNVTGFIIEKENIELLAEKMETLFLNKNLMKELGQNGRNKVKNEYEWDMCVDKMIKIYENQLIKKI